MNQSTLFTIKRIWYGFTYFVNCILFPPAKVMFVIWTLCWLASFSLNRVALESGHITVIIIGYVVYCGIADLFYLIFQKKYINYKMKITKKHMDQLKKLIKDTDPVYYEKRFGTDDENNLNFITKNDLKQDNFVEAGYWAIYNGKISPGMIQRHCKVGFNTAMKILDELEQHGVVSPDTGTGYRNVWVTRSKFEKIINRRERRLLHGETGNEWFDNYDEMSGIEFEDFCAEILIKNGFEHVETTKVTGDHGIDILAEKDDITYAIQCKCYSSNVGNAAIQQALTGKQFYGRDVAVVMTNQYFTTQAKEEAHVLGVKLWDRNKLDEMII